MKTFPFIYLGVLCGDGCTITLDKKTTTVYKNGQQLLTWHRNKDTIMWEFPLLTHKFKAQTIATVQNILSQTTKPELVKYYHDALFSPTNTSLLNLKNKVFS